MEKCNRKDWIAYDIIRVTKNKLATFIPRQSCSLVHTQKYTYLQRNVKITIVTGELKYKRTFLHFP